MQEGRGAGLAAALFLFFAVVLFSAFVRTALRLPLSKKIGSCPRVFFNFRLLQEADVQYDGKPELREMYYWLCVTAKEGKMR